MTVTDITAQITARDGAAVTVYTRSTPYCAKCVATKRALDRRGVTYTEVDLAHDQAAMDYVKGLGATAAPLVYVSSPDGDDYWWDLRLDKIEQHFGRTAAA